MRAIERFLSSCTVPVIYQSDTETHVEASGTFFRARDKVYLVTCRHVVQEAEGERFGIPAHPNGSACVWHLAQAKIHFPRSEDGNDFDVAAIEINDPTFIRDVVSGWRVLDETNVADIDAAATEYVIAGYPTATVEDRDGELTPKPMLQLFTGPYEGVLEKSAGPFDLILRHGATGSAVFGERRPLPRMQGVSGAAVYQITQTTSPVWSPDQELKLVAIQSAAMHGSYIRAKSWRLVQQILRLLEGQ